jgi:hypothetical protein
MKEGKQKQKTLPEGELELLKLTVIFKTKIKYKKH